MAPRKKATSGRKKYCHCSPICNKKLVRRTRRHHYKQIPDQRRHLIRASESCSDTDLEYHSALSPLNETTVPSNHLESHQGSFDGQELNESDASGSSGGMEGGEAFKDELKEESEGDHEGDYGMAQVSGSEGNDEEADGVSNYSENLDSDDEIKLGGFSDSEDVDSEFDEWKAFDEEVEAERSDDDALREFEEMMGDEEYAELWSTRKFSLYHFLLLFNNIFSYRKRDPNRRRP